MKQFFRDVCELVVCFSLMAVVLVLLGIRLWSVSGPVEPKWLSFNPPEADDSRGRLEDCFSRLEPKYQTEVKKNDQMGPPDKPNICHEATHYLNSMLRCADDPKNQDNDAVYIDHGRYLLFDHPKVTITQVIEFLDEDTKALVKDVMPTRTDWEKEPLYILDEWTAYSNGTVCAKEVGADRPRIDLSRKHMMCCGRIADALIRCTEARDPTYPQLADLKVFVTWQHTRTNTILDQTAP